MPGAGGELAGGVDEPSREEFYDRAPVAYLSLLIDGTVVQVNDTFLAWTGHTREQVLGERDFASLLTVGGQIFYETHCLPLLLGGRSVEQVSLDIRRADGTAMPVLFAAATHRRDAEGRPALIRATIVDLSQRRLFEQQLVSRNDALSRSNDELDTFAHAAAHDLQAPLRGIRQNTEFFLEDTAGQLPPGTEDLLQKVVRLSGRMKDMLDDLLAYAQAGRGAWDPEPVSLTAAIGEVLELLGPRTQGAAVSVADETITTDAAVLRQVMLNVVGNAVKYSAAPAEISVGVCRLADAAGRPAASPALAEVSPDAPVLTVVDKGVGINERHLEQIFDLFLQLDPDADGSGAGLALCRALCRRHGGDIWLTSTPGVGTTFFILMRAEKQDDDDSPVS